MSSSMVHGNIIDLEHCLDHWPKLGKGHSLILCYCLKAVEKSFYCLLSLG